jgi:hypothetical protein
MSQVGAFGVNYLRTFDATTVPSLPAKLGDTGSTVEGTFIFVKAAENLTQYDWVSVKDDHTVVQMDNTEAGTKVRNFGAAQVAASTNEYLWVWIGGPNGGGSGSGIKARFINYTAKASVYTTATGGVCDDASGGSFVLLPGVIGVTTVGGTAAAAEVQSVRVLSID